MMRVYQVWPQNTVAVYNRNAYPCQRLLPLFSHLMMMTLNLIPKTLDTNHWLIFISFVKWCNGGTRPRPSHHGPEKGESVFKVVGNIREISSIPSLLCLTVLSHFLPLSFLHLIFSSPHSLPTISKLCGSIQVMVPEGALTLPSLSCSSSSCGAAVGDTKGSLHLRGQPTSSWDSEIDYRSDNQLFSTTTKKKSTALWCLWKVKTALHSS